MRIIGWILFSLCTFFAVANYVCFAIGDSVGGDWVNFVVGSGDVAVGIVLCMLLRDEEGF
jgi:hypothetical protein